jgi:hypothetical protein
MSKEIEKSLFSDLSQIIEQGKQQAVAQVNSTQTLTYWYVGKKINEHILKLLPIKNQDSINYYAKKASE